MTEQTKTIEELDAQIESLKEELKNVHGTETEVYARIVGYYRAVKNWNKGKRDEYNHRKLFTVDETFSGQPDCQQELQATLFNETFNSENNINSKNESAGTEESSAPADYEFFMRKTCPNCPPVKAFMEELNLTGKLIDVDTDEGLRIAAAKGVFSAPTVIFYDENGTEIARAHSVEDIKTSIPEMNLAQAV
ncbi:MAG: anaerobic ribonucleoside-triphosphate reductase [Treponema berlinense]|uniref:anaerobic ribonucleoside-triphosphate reductase n=1 Tax=Treponema berlinense TaxID=225004 RepID=UPI00235378C6|nr:anaerobic ribonucleoside-triphosphate reductase [Treponema berlinense]MDY3707762.1 anaerobic ribonucleoside-triphosphate reductase [Treponema berlinense]